MKGQLKPVVVIVAGSIRERDLDAVRFDLLNTGRIAKVVRLSRQQFANDFMSAVDEIGLADFAEIGSYRPLKMWVKAVDSVKGQIGAVVVDTACWGYIKDVRPSLDATTIWLTHEGVCRRVPALV